MSAAVGLWLWVDVDGPISGWGATASDARAAALATWTDAFEDTPQTRRTATAEAEVAKGRPLLVTVALVGDESKLELYGLLQTMSREYRGNVMRGLGAIVDNEGVLGPVHKAYDAALAAHQRVNELLNQRDKASHPHTKAGYDEAARVARHTAGERAVDVLFALRAMWEPTA